jgi:phage baseplate assembly protein W
MARSGAKDPITNEIRYSDLGVTMTAHPVTKKPPVYKNAEAVKRAVRNLVLTNQGERPYEPLYGCSVLDRLFENFDPIEELDLKKDIELAIKNYEPRALVEEVIVIADHDNNELRINIRFSVINMLEPIDLQINVQRIR